MTNDVRQLVEYRLDQAAETLAAGLDLYRHSHVRDAISRGYYAMFYAALALLAAKQLGTSKHSGAIALLGERFVKAGEFPPDIAAYLGRAFDLRLKCDYREFSEPQPSEAEELLAQAQEFIAAARSTWERITHYLKRPGRGVMSRSTGVSPVRIHGRDGRATVLR